MKIVLWPLQEALSPVQVMYELNACKLLTLPFKETA